MADLTDELAGLNENARLLLEKYDGVFAQLDEQSKQALIDIANKSDEGLQAIQTLLDNGSVAEAENALKLGGKSLDEVLNSVEKSFFNIVRHDDITGTGDIKVSSYNENIISSNVEVDLENGTIKILRDGTYCLTAQWSFTGGDGDDTQEYQFFVNDSSVYVMLDNNSMTGDGIEALHNMTYIIDLKVDDVIQFGIYNINTGTILDISFQGFEL